MERFPSRATGHRSPLVLPTSNHPVVDVVGIILVHMEGIVPALFSRCLDLEQALTGGGDPERTSIILLKAHDTTIPVISTDPVWVDFLQIRIEEGQAPPVTQHDVAGSAFEHRADPIGKQAALHVQVDEWALDDLVDPPQASHPHVAFAIAVKIEVTSPDKPPPQQTGMGLVARDVILLAVVIHPSQETPTCEPHSSFPIPVDENPLLPRLRKVNGLTERVVFVPFDPADPVLSDDPNPHALSFQTVNGLCSHVQDCRKLTIGPVQRKAAETGLTPDEEVSPLAGQAQDGFDRSFFSILLEIEPV
jgi:hypothetical protein